MEGVSERFLPTTSVILYHPSDKNVSRADKNGSQSNTAAKVRQSPTGHSFNIRLHRLDNSADLIKKVKLSEYRCRGSRVSVWILQR